MQTHRHVATFVQYAQLYVPPVLYIHSHTLDPPSSSTLPPPPFQTIIYINDTDLFNADCIIITNIDLSSCSLLAAACLRELVACVSAQAVMCHAPSMASIPLEVSYSVHRSALSFLPPYNYIYNCAIDIILG